MKIPHFFHFSLLWNIYWGFTPASIPIGWWRPILAWIRRDYDDMFLYVSLSLSLSLSFRFSVLSFSFPFSPLSLFFRGAWALRSPLDPHLFQHKLSPTDPNLLFFMQFHNVVDRNRFKDFITRNISKYIEIKISFVFVIILFFAGLQRASDKPWQQLHPYVV